MCRVRRSYANRSRRHSLGSRRAVEVKGGSNGPDKSTRRSGSGSVSRYPYYRASRCLGSRRASSRHARRRQNCRRWRKRHPTIGQSTSIRRRCRKRNRLRESRVVRQSQHNSTHGPIWCDKNCTNTPSMSDRGGGLRLTSWKYGPFHDRRSSRACDPLSSGSRSRYYPSNGSRGRSRNLSR